MIQAYTVDQIMQADEPADDWGQKYYVQFKESEANLTLSYKNPNFVPKPGDVIRGEILSNRGGYAYFKKEAKQMPTPPVQNDSRGNYVPKKSYTAQQADKSDGQRQGMCLNNAANSVEFMHIEDDQEWSQRVHARANYLYGLGDLSGQTTEAVKDVFGIK